MKPCSAIQKSLYIFERYLFPVSATKLTTRLGCVCCRQSRSAHATTVSRARAPQLFPNFGPSCPFLRERIRRIPELVHVKAARNFFSQSRGDVLVIFRVAARHVRAC